MGLAAPRNKTKISADPRNTHWATNTTRFGHRMLTSHGWRPGSTLGDSSSAYHKSGHISEASNAGVKIVMKGDNLGIGCKASSQQDESTGLDAFQNLLGRLNGKAEEDIKKDGEVRMKLMAQGRYGMRFVKGETYFSSDIEKLREDIRRVAKEKECKTVEEGVARKEAEAADLRVGRKKRKKMRECQDKVDNPSTPPDPVEKAAQKQKDKKRDKKKDKKSNKDKLSSPTPTPSPPDNTDSTSNPRPKKRKRAEDGTRMTKDDHRKKRSKNSSETSIPVPADAPLTGRHAIRHRYIAAKRSAVMDAKALNEILMIKA